MAITGKLYPVAFEEWRRIPHRQGAPASRYRGRATGEKRPVQPGEWYVSGAIPEVWRFPGATGEPTDTPYYIAELVRGHTVKTFVVEEVIA